MKKIMYLLIASLFLFACNQESIKLKGELEGLEDGTLLVKMKTNKKIREKCIDTIQVVDGEFEFRSNDIKPPVRLTMFVSEDCEFDVWIGKYGSYSVTGNLNEIKEPLVYKDDLAKEYQAYYHRLDSAYIIPVREKMQWVKQKNEQIKNGEKLSQDDEFTMFDYRKDIKKAFSRRRMSIVKTVRANPNSPIVMAIVQKEYKSFNNRHKEEMKKIFRRRFSDTALYWQLCP
ncbi:DUF4369 domain-containing protein [Marinifilum sp.]|uniref:DUF4369 domain-containing protein n=1 Tax=Marinifilum sp. TaxID=2033137 RepID=UPI003BAAE0DF